MAAQAEELIALMTIGSETTSARLTELHRQTEVLVHKGYLALAGLGDDAFRALVCPLESQLPAEPFVLVVTSALVPLDRLIALAVLSGKPGFTTMDVNDIAKFRPDVRPDDALPLIQVAGRTPLTLDEGLAVATQHPEWLRERNCFEMLGSRAGDKCVTGIWVSDGAPRLGWCWGGNPHTWLGMASAAARIA